MEQKQDFRQIFLGEYVEILGKNGTITAEGDSIPLVIQGFILESDDEFVFIGETPLEIKSAIKKADISYIEIIEPTDEYEEILENMPRPKSKYDEN